MSAELQRATELRRRMTADIAHDLRTPLTVIAGYLEALRDAELPATPARFAAMHTETQTLLRLVEDLHTLSLADAGELPLRCREIAVDDLLERIVRIYNDAAQQAGIRLHRQSEPAGMRIYGDEEQLVRALSNLVSNALRYTPEGGEIVIEATRQGHQIMLSVQDTGPGIPPEHLPNVFERFYRIDESRHTGSGGSGLGLAIVRSIAQAHNGTATVHSTPGAGARFTIALPAETKNVVPVP
jgi:signal transduction histidine kinase